MPLGEYRREAILPAVSTSAKLSASTSILLSVNSVELPAVSEVEPFDFAQGKLLAPSEVELPAPSLVEVCPAVESRILLFVNPSFLPN